MYTTTKITIGCLMASCFMLGALLNDHPPVNQVVQTVAVERSTYHTLYRPVYQKIKGDPRYIVTQRDLLAAAIPAHLLQPIKRSK